MDTDTVTNAELRQLVSLLQDHQARRHDVVAPASSLRYEGGQLVVTEGHPDMPGITLDSTYSVNRVAQRQLGDVLGIPTKYWDHMVDREALDLLDHNVNHWLGADARSFMVRTLTGVGEDPGMVRAVLSDRYRVMDDLDVLMATLDGLRQADVDTTGLDISCDRTLSRMYVRITAHEVAVAAGALADRYRDPRSGRNGRDYPMVFAGLVLSNSEVGHGSFSITPRIVWQVCTNGMTMKQDVERSVHLGGRLDQGVVRWSEDTQQKNLELVASATRDAVATFLSPEYVQAKLSEMADAASVQLASPSTAVEVVCTKMRYTQDQQQSILDAFIGGGDTSALGLAQAVTNMAQDQDPDTRAELEADSMRVLHLAAQHG